MEWKNIFRGFVMGISDLIPGVSGGTLAVVLGIYDQLLESISGVFSKDWKRHVSFLFPLGVGVGLALVLLSKLIEYLLEYHYEPTQFFFIGLIIGVIPLITKRANVRQNFKMSHILVLLLAALLVASMAFTKPDKSADPITTLTLLTVLGLFFSGWLASMAMLLPGISGSFVLLLLGVYPTAIYALSNFDLPIIATIGAGVIAGFVSSSKGISYMLKHYPHVTHAVILGLIIGSVFVVFPGVVSGLQLIISVVTLVVGFVTAVALGSTAKN
ncbi:DUF368 domain-containing protein [Bacillus sp. HMF5848]|uniref:DUF368 domain-containing protein n=1 Tax=Bacillus sp. HMF5848 TaxID=2495421 RepID=UPI000F769541|nr:DUF368 domain-containing protein [Bacillus sp. HMF5848]RSK29090.1 DUF368 domain-containing protein [Bacillus sp. HMF5848]